ncbi:MAG: ABC transporter permease, partial [Actinomycetota bacterium]|nr:ABC transporter permease [Actinomycetota bacterium]
MTSSTTWWRLVAAREVTTRLRDKTFLISTAVLLVFVLGGIVAANLIGGRPSSYDVAVTDAAGRELAAGAQVQLRAMSDEAEATVEVTEVDDDDAARTAVDEGEVDVALLPTDDGFEIVGRDEVPADLAAAAQGALSLTALRSNAEQAGTTVQALTSGSTLTQDTTASGPVSADAAGGAAFLMALLFFITAIGFGIAIAQSVVVEKENRIVEILAAAVPLRALLW